MDRSPFTKRATRPALRLAWTSSTGSKAITIDSACTRQSTTALPSNTKPYALLHDMLYEPHRIWWRLVFLRESSHEQEAKQVFPGSPRARSA